MSTAFLALLAIIPIVVAPCPDGGNALARHQGNALCLGSLLRLRDDRLENRGPASCGFVDSGRDHRNRRFDHRLWRHTYSLYPGKNGGMETIQYGMQRCEQGSPRPGHHYRLFVRGLY